MSLPPYQRQTMITLLQAPGAVVIRNVNGGEPPFLYSSGNYGPGYVTIKGMVGQKRIIEPLTFQLATKVAEEFPDLDFVAGNVSGGVVPGWILRARRWSHCLVKKCPLSTPGTLAKKGATKNLSPVLIRIPSSPRVATAW